MESLIILFLLGLIALVLVLPITAIIQASRAARNASHIMDRLEVLEADLRRLRARIERIAAPTESPESTLRGGMTAPMRTESAAAGEVQDATQAADTPTATSPNIPAPPVGESLSPPVFVAPLMGSRPPPIGFASTPPAPIPEPEDILDRIRGNLNWEQFMGAKMFAWIGGFALFLAAAYFVKYSFEHDLIPPELRVAIGFLFGTGLIVSGVVLRRKEYTVTSHTFCATGVVILYAVTFACHAVYHFAPFSAVPTFVLMAVITAAAFVLSVRMPAMVVAILGLLGGFLTPILLSTGQDAPVALFTYIAMLDAGLIAVALNRRWFFLAPLAAAGTVLTQVGWAAEFFQRGEYYLGNKVLLPMIVLLGFNALWLAATRFVRKHNDSGALVALSAVALSFVSFAFGFYCLSFESLAARPWLLFGFAFLVDAAVIALTCLDRRLNVAQPIAGGAVFLMLAVWLSSWITNQLLPAALVFTVVFALMHSLPPALRSFGGDSGRSSKSVLVFPPLALMALLIPILKLAELTFLVWPVILLVDVVAFILAWIFLSVLPLLAVLLLTLAATAVAILRIPADFGGLSSLLLVVFTFAAVFVSAGVWLRRRFPDRGPETDEWETEKDMAALVIIMAIVLPFALLLMIVGRLPLTNPTPVFGIALLLTGLAFVVTRMMRLDWLPVVGLVCVAAVESAWHFRLFDAAAALTPLVWYLTFFGVFAAFPFVQIEAFKEAKGPWIAGALAGPAQFLLVYRLVEATWPNEIMGLLPAAFAVPALGSFALVRRRVSKTSPTRLMQLALYGGVVLFFITLILPIQFERQWLTIGWALEGAALCWLFRRLPHPGLRAVGVALLITAFVRLALNPAVLGYHPRSEVPILNWYMYAYGLVVLSLFAGARLLAPPRDRLLEMNAPALLGTLGTILAFLLVNIQIADFFTEPGTAALTFQFTGNFGRDMTYSIAWALFALGMLIFGFSRQLAPIRYAAIGLLGATVLKLFLHDLAHLQQLYRIGALAGVAVIAIVASFLYQRFVAAAESADDAPAKRYED